MELLFICGAVLYFLPSIIGWSKDNFLSILLLNIFLGWTFIGWVVALVWACSTDKPAITQVINKKPESKADELTKLAELKEKGVITQEEFEAQKTRILL